MAKPASVSKMRRALMRSNTRLLLSAVMIFQAAAMALVALSDGGINLQAMLLAAALPAVTFLTVSLMGKIWPVDRAVVILVMFLCSVGIITLSDIARSPITPRNQAVYALAGICAMFFGAWFIRVFKDWRKWTPWLMGLCLLALLSPLALGDRSKNAYNWISIAGVSIQPSEFIKPALILILAAGLSNHPRFLKTLPTLGFAAACCGVLLLEKDLGALLLYFLTTVLMFFVATSNVILTLAGLGMGAVSAVIAYRMFDYVKERIAIWINPWADPLDSGHQVVQALIAIGSGGLFGMGLGLGTPRKIPLYHSDFIFAAIAEEFGVIFSVGLLAVYVLIIMRGLVISANARTSFHSLLSFGLVAMLGLQAMLIVGGNTKLLPLTGVTLPLISSGGSSLMSTFLSMGILLGVSSMNAEDEARDIDRIELTREVFE